MTRTTATRWLQFCFRVLHIFLYLQHTNKRGWDACCLIKCIKVLAGRSKTEFVLDDLDGLESHGRDLGNEYRIRNVRGPNVGSFTPTCRSNGTAHCTLMTSIIQYDAMKSRIFEEVQKKTVEESRQGAHDIHKPTHTRTPEKSAFSKNYAQNMRTWLSVHRSGLYQ